MGWHISLGCPFCFCVLRDDGALLLALSLFFLTVPEATHPHPFSPHSPLYSSRYHTGLSCAAVVNIAAGLNHGVLCYDIRASIGLSL